MTDLRSGQMCPGPVASFSMTRHDDEWLGFQTFDRSAITDGSGRCLPTESAHSWNTQAIEFYEALGFARDDAVSMGKRLIEDPG